MRKSLSQFKKEMHEYYKSSDAVDEGPFKEWFEDLLSAIKEEGKLIKEGNRTYIED